MRFIIVLGSAATLVFLGFMAAEFGTDHQDQLTIMGPVYTGKVNTDVVPAELPAAAPALPVQSAAMASVSIVTAGPLSQLWLDGKPMGQVHKKTLEVGSGKHVIMVRQDHRTLMQKVFLNAGDDYLVEFQEKVTVTKRP